MTTTLPPSQECPFGKIEGPVWHTVYHHLPVVSRGEQGPSINQSTNGKRTSMQWIGGQFGIKYCNHFYEPLPDWW